MGKLQSIRCHYCRKLLWSGRWSEKRRLASDDGKHRCPGLVEGRRKMLLGAVANCLERAQQQLEQALNTLGVLEKDAKCSAKPRTSAVTATPKKGTRGAAKKRRTTSKGGGSAGSTTR